MHEQERESDTASLERENLSTADLANRLVSLRLAPTEHPLPADRRRTIVADAVRALRRRFDVSSPVKAIFAAWFLAVAVAPRPLARAMANAFFFPARRAGLTSILRRFGSRGHVPDVAEFGPR